MYVIDCKRIFLHVPRRILQLTVPIAVAQFAERFQIYCQQLFRVPPIEQKDFSKYVVLRWPVSIANFSYLLY